MEVYKKIVIFSMVFAVMGCTGRIVHMKNDQGVEAKCEVSTGSAMLTGVLMRDASINSCIEEKEKEGFKVTHEE